MILLMNSDLGMRQFASDTREMSAAAEPADPMSVHEERHARARRDARLAFSDPNHPPILIYQMGKVGSTSVAESLRRLQLPNQVINIHFLSVDLGLHKRLHRKSGLFPFPYHLYMGTALRRQLLANPGFPVRIISLVRDPIAFKVSNLFQNPSFTKALIRDESGAIDPHKATRFIERGLVVPNAFSYMNDWFDREIKSVFGIDVLLNPFPAGLGYGSFSNGMARALVLQLESLNTVGAAAIATFLGLSSPVPIVRSNERLKSAESQIYNQVLNSLRIKSSVCEAIYSTPFPRHFYSPSALAGFAARWSSPGGA